jgi:hypothetical protein
MIGAERKCPSIPGTNEQTVSLRGPDSDGNPVRVDQYLVMLIRAKLPEPIHRNPSTTQPGDGARRARIFSRTGIVVSNERRFQP